MDLTQAAKDDVDELLNALTLTFDCYEKLKSISRQGLLNTVYYQLYDESRAVYEIDLEFIKSLGSNCSKAFKI